MKILLVEDDRRIAAFVKRGLEAEGYTIEVAEDGREALERLRSQEYSIVILDRMLPYLDGLEVCRTMRRERNAAMVLMLTAKDTLSDKVEGLSVGADDYLTKPFAFDELLARILALSRRRPGGIEPVSALRVGDLTLDLAAKRATRGTRVIALTAKEFALLHYLMAHSGQVVSRQRLLSAVWDYAFEPGTKVVDVYIRYLRRKIDEGEATTLIRTVRGFGYTIAATVERDHASGVEGGPDTSPRN